MRNELKEALIAWKSRPSFAAEKRLIRIAPNPAMEFEFRIEISISEIISFKNSKTTVVETALMSTYAQASNLTEVGGRPYPDPQGDVYRFNTISINVEMEFWVRREEELTKIIQKEMPDGFFDFNDL